jgi:peptidoglycan hydrolase-like amidase
MTHHVRLKLLRLALSLIILTGLLGTSPTMSKAVAPLATVSDSLLIYYRPTRRSNCIGPISLGDFIKHTLPNEWIDSWANVPGGMEALKAGAVAIRTFTISAYNTETYNVGGQDYYCTNAYWQYGFDLSEPTLPNSNAAVDATNGIILTHPNATARLGNKAIDAQYRRETGGQTVAGDYPWLASILDPISTGLVDQGMGQYGSKRWAL